MYSNPFDNDEGLFFVLVNDDGQYSIWPSFKEVPAGWAVEREAGPRQESLDYIKTAWKDLRTKSLIARMGG